MSETTKFMKWDGICFEDVTKPENKPGWRNQDKLGTTPPRPPQGTGSATTASAPASGPTLSAQQAEVVLVSVSQLFAPIEEYAVIELKFKHIHQIHSLLLQIKDADDQLVYAERLDSESVLRLPDNRADVEGRNPPVSKKAGALDAAARKARWEAKWANPVGTPYTISVWVHVKSAPGAFELPFDVKAETTDANGSTTRHRSMNPGALPPVTPPNLTVEQTSVRLTDRLTTVSAKWEEIFERLTGKEFPQAIAGLADDNEKLLWAKCRLSQIGFSAGPIDTKKNQEDFVKAAKRYAAMRGIGGKVHYRINNSLVDGLPSPYEDPDFAQLLASLEKERLLAQNLRAFSNADQLGDGGAEPLKVYIDANCFFTTTSERKDDTESKWLTPPCLPIRVRLPVMCRDGRTSADVPEVLEPLFFQWTWQSPAEAANRLPDPAAPGQIAGFNGSFDEAGTFRLAGPPAQVYADPQYRSKARTYLDVTRRRMCRAPGGYPPDQHNAAFYVGGQVAGDAARNLQVVFLTLGKDPTKTEHRVRARADGLEPYLLAATVVADVNSPSRNGAVSVPGPYIYFYPSIIAGDQYVLTAELFLEQQRTAKCADFGATPARRVWMDSFCVPAPAMPAAPRFRGSTRRLEGWRRLRIARFVQWGAQPTTYDGKPFDLHAVWEAVKKEYGFAYIEFQDCGLPGSPPCTSANLSAVLPNTNHAVVGTLPVCRTQDLVLKDSHYRNRGAKLLQTGVKAEYNSLADAVNALLPGSANGVTAGRPVPPDQLVFSPDRILPPLPVKPLTLAAQNLPKITEVVDLVFLGVLNNYGRIRDNPLTGDELKRFEAAWLLINEWRQYDRSDPLKTAVLLVGESIFQVLCQVIAYTPAPGGGTFSWVSEKGQPVEVNRCQYFGADGKIEYIPNLLNDINFAYTHQEFARLMDLMFMPDIETSPRGECARWVRGESLDANRTLGLLALIEPLQRGPGPLWEGDEHTGDFRSDKHYYTGWALRRYCEYFGYVLDVPQNKFKDLPSEQRNLMLCLTYPDVVEATVHNARYANKVIYEHPSSKALGEQLAWCLDQIVRKGLLCQTDSDPDSPQYQSFADGIIVLNARVYPTITIEGTPFEVAGPSVGFPLGLVFTSHQSAMEPYALLAHEIAHVVYMQHDRNTQASYILHHDHEDHNCMMSYPLNELPRLASVPPTVSNTYETNRLARYIYLHINGWPDLVDFMNQPSGWNANRETVRMKGNFLPNSPVPIFRPHFCGKCLVRLRGWNIHAQMAAATAPPSLEPAAPAAAGPGGAGPGGGPPMGPAPLAPPMGPLGAMAPMMWGAAAAPAAAPAAGGPFNWDDPANLDPVTSGHPDLLPISSGLPFHKLDRVNRQFPVGMVYPHEGQEVTVKTGDTLCSIAMASGHKNCYPIWAHPRNGNLGSRPIAPGTVVYIPPSKAAGVAPVNATSPVVIHFIRGANTAEPDLANLNLSNYHPAKGGPNGDQPFPDKNVRSYDAAGYADVDAFQVEVEYLDGFLPPAKAQLKLAALLPTYAADGTVSGHTDFPDAETPARSLETELAPSAINQRRLRSCYLRLISLRDMKTGANGRPDQTLLVTDYNPTQPNVEPLDQKIRASLAIPGCGCKPDSKCLLLHSIDIDRSRNKVVDVVIRVLKKDAGDGVVNVDDVRTNILTASRNVFAPAHLKFRIARAELVDAPSEMLTVDNDQGRTSTTGGQVRFTVVHPGGTKSVVANVAAGRTPLETAQDIAAAIGDIPGVQAHAAANPPIGGTGGRRSADLYFTGGRVTITNLVSPDPAQPISRATLEMKCAPDCRQIKIGSGATRRDEAPPPGVLRDPRLTSGAYVEAGDVIIDNREPHFHIGSPEMRMIFRGLDTSARFPNAIDVVCVKALFNPTSSASADGYALGDFAGFGDARPDNYLKNSVLLAAASASSKFPAAAFLPHEFGHVLIGTGQHVISDEAKFAHCLMWASPGAAAGGPHYTLNDGVPTEHNWTKMQLKVNREWDWQTTETEASDAVGKILANGLARNA